MTADPDDQCTILVVDGHEVEVRHPFGHIDGIVVSANASDWLSLDQPGSTVPGQVRVRVGAISAYWPSR
jgi:hypothetical protein